MTENKGQVLIESMVGISIAVIALSGILVLTTNAFRVNRNVGQKTVAVYLAGEGVEVVKNMIDTNYANCEVWNSGLSNDGTYLVQYDSNSLTFYDGEQLRLRGGSNTYQYDAGPSTNYSRSVQITNIDPDLDGSDDEMKVVSTVTWPAAGEGTESVSVEDHFFDWRAEGQLGC